MSTNLVVSFVSIFSLCVSCFGQAFTERDQAFMGVVGSGDITNACDITHNLLSKWTFNEGAGITAYDSAGGRNGTLSAVAGGHSLPQWNTPGFGPYNTNINFPDSYSYVTMGSSPYWNFYTNWHWTVTIWENHTNITRPDPSTGSYWNDIEGLFSIPLSISNPYILMQFKQTREDFTRCNKAHWQLVLNGSGWLTGESQTWHMCALDNNTITNLTKYFWSIVRNWDSIIVYTNGAVAATNGFFANGRPTTTTASPTLWVGGDLIPGTLRGWQGNIQEMRIYLASLTATEITNLWNHLANNGPCP